MKQEKHTPSRPLKLGRLAMVLSGLDRSSVLLTPCHRRIPSSPCGVAISGAVRGSCWVFKPSGVIAHEMAVAASASLMSLSSSWIDSCGQRAGRAPLLGASGATRVERQNLLAVGRLPTGWDLLLSWFQWRLTFKSYNFPSSISDETQMARELLCVKWVFSPRLAVHVFAHGTILPNKASQEEIEKGISACTSCQIVLS